VVEHVAPFAGGERGAGKLAVDRVEERHAPGRRQSGGIGALEEQPEGGDRQDGPDQRHPVRRHAERGTRSRGMEGRPRPDVLGDEVGRALVGAHEHPPLDRGAVLRRHDEAHTASRACASPSRRPRRDRRAPACRAPERRRLLPTAAGRRRRALRLDVRGDRRLPVRPLADQRQIGSPARMATSGWSSTASALTRTTGPSHFAPRLASATRSPRPARTAAAAVRPGSCPTAVSSLRPRMHTGLKCGDSQRQLHPGSETDRAFAEGTVFLAARRRSSRQVEGDCDIMRSPRRAPSRPPPPRPG
jgi:hypothetical protein